MSDNRKRRRINQAADAIRVAVESLDTAIDDLNGAGYDEQSEDLAAVFTKVKVIQHTVRELAALEGVER